MEKYISLIGLGAVGAPLADSLYKKYKSDFVLLSSKDHASRLNNLYINDKPFCPKVISDHSQLQKKIALVLVCVKNYQLQGVIGLLKELIDNETIIIPLQNGLYSYNLFCTMFPDNCVLQGFAQGPNTKTMGNIISYQKPGSIHIGTSINRFRANVEFINDLLNQAGINCFYDKDIEYQVWKKLMLNVAGNAITALTGMDYCMFSHSSDVLLLCRRVMKEYCKISFSEGIELTDKDIEDIINYFLSFKVSKRTSMLEDVLNKRQTENEFIAGYISKLAKKRSIDCPNIDMLYYLIKIKEEVYLNKF